LNFGFDDDQHEIRRTARALLAQRSPFAAVRAVAQSGAYDRLLWSEMAELGWPGIAIDEQHGGAGLGAVELAILLEEAGYALAASPLLGTTCAAFVLESAGSEAQRATWLPQLASGAASAALAVGDDALVADADDAQVIVMIDDSGRGRLLERADADVQPIATIDPTRHYARVSGPGAELAGDVARGVNKSLVAISAEMTGICQRAVDMTVDYVKDRKQFDTPVGAFQAVSHRCAEMFLLTEGARSATYAAAWAADAGDESLAEYALVAKTAASDGAREVTAAAIQMHGGIGFTWEADVHWLFKRAQVDARQLGTATKLRAQLARLVAARTAVAG
jgi:alkylation response protein AidB-like acyl-CoA dehydrogenase